MRILIIGAGVVGYHIARQLSREGQDIALVEHRPEVLRRVVERLDVANVEGDGATPSVLERAGVRASDMVIAVTESDAVNVTVCVLAHRYGVKRKIARVRNREWTGEHLAFLREVLKVDRLINPEELIVDEIVKVIETPGCIEAANLEVGDVLVRGFAIEAGAPACGMSLIDLRRSSPVPFVVVFIERGERPIVPGGSDTLEPGDRAYIVLDRRHLHAVHPLLVPDGSTARARRAIIFGGGNTGIALARGLASREIRTTLIEDDPARAKAASAALSETTVLAGSATEMEVLEEAGTGEADYFIGAHADDRSNLLAGLLAKKMGARRTIVVANEPDYKPVLESIGMDVVINPRLVTVAEILRHVRKGRILGLAKVGRTEAEAIELEVVDGARAVGKTLKEVRLPRGTIVGAVVREGQVVIPDGDTVIHPKEVVVVFAMPAAVRDVERIFSRRARIF